LPTLFLSDRITMQINACACERLQHPEYLLPGPFEEIDEHRLV